MEITNVHAVFNMIWPRLHSGAYYLVVWQWASSATATAGAANRKRRPTANNKLTVVAVMIHITMPES